MKNKSLEKFVNNVWVKLLTIVLAIIGFAITIFTSSDSIRYFALILFVVCLILTFIFLAYRYFSEKAIERRVQSGIEKRNKLFFDNYAQCIEQIVLATQQIKISEDLDKRQFSEIMRNICIVINDAISTLMKDVPFSVCVKSIDPGALKDRDINTWKTVTIARAGSNTINRAKNDAIPQLVRENTSFLTILHSENQCHVWPSPNLKETARAMAQSNLKYLNPDSNYRKYYSSTIVAPIRIQSQYVDPLIIKQSDRVEPNAYHCLGFLCIDSTKTFEQDDTSFANLAIFLKALGHQLYSLLEEKLLIDLDKKE